MWLKNYSSSRNVTNSIESLHRHTCQVSRIVWETLEIWWFCTSVWPKQKSRIRTSVWPILSPSLATLCWSFLTIQSNPTPVNIVISEEFKMHSHPSEQVELVSNHRNASSGRQFSIVKKNCTQFRTSMSDTTLSCVLLAKCRRSEHS